VIAWNAEHGWASFVKQGSRTTAWDPARALQFLGELVGGQIGLATPLIFVMLVAGSWRAGRQAWRTREPSWTLLAALVWPGTLIFIQHALGDRVQGNWPAILFPAAALAAAGLDGRRWLRLRVPAVAVGAAITAAAYAQATLAPLPLPPRFDPTALKLAGWQGLADEVASVARERGASLVAADDYGVAAEFALLLSTRYAVIGNDPRWRFFGLGTMPGAGASGILVRSTGPTEPADAAPWGTIERIGEATRSRGAGVVERFGIYSVTGRRPGPALAVLPRPADAGPVSH
jgi:hypothetical protein